MNQPKRERLMTMRELNEKGIEDFERLIGAFKKKMELVASEVLDALYTNLGSHIETDAWTNYREQLRMELGGGFYKTPANSLDGEWAKGVRQMIMEEHRDVLVPLLNKDLMSEIENLKQELKHAYERRF